MTACIHGEVCREYVRRFSHLCRKGLFSGGDGYACILSRDCPSGCRFYEPEERTCHDVSNGGEEFRCSECGTQVEVECDGFVLLIGGKTDNIRFCPNCGARVVANE